MIRSQIYLTEDERDSLKIISKETGRTQSDLIREAVDSLISQITKKNSNEKRQEAFGIWKDREDYPDTRALRNEFDRSF
ncbi:MAG TPA: ribbon-helix-helix domain-containing protein [Gammaproteobacteria bacterium]|nr:ribbon-helix-helix domain-containing protein [Gammaproteobacteria bacterium]